MEHHFIIDSIATTETEGTQAVVEVAAGSEELQIAGTRGSAAAEEIQCFTTLYEALENQECITLDTDEGVHRFVQLLDALRADGHVDGADSMDAVMKFCAGTLSSSRFRNNMRRAHKQGKSMIPFMQPLLRFFGAELLLGPWTKESLDEFNARVEHDPAAQRNLPRAKKRAETGLAALTLAEVPDEARAQLLRVVTDLVLTTRCNAGSGSKAIVGVGGEKVLSIACHAEAHTTREKTLGCAKVTGAVDSAESASRKLIGAGVRPEDLTSTNVHVLFGGPADGTKFRETLDGFFDNRWTRDTLDPRQRFTADVCVGIDVAGDSVVAQMVWCATKPPPEAAAARLRALGIAQRPRTEQFCSVALYFGGTAARHARARCESAAPPTAAAAVQHAAAASGGGCSTPAPKRRDRHQSPSKWASAALDHHARVSADDGACEGPALLRAALAASAEDAAQHPVERPACDDDGDGEDAALTQALAASARAALTQALAASAREHAASEADRASEAENLRRALAESSLAHGAGSGSAR